MSVCFPHANDHRVPDVEFIAGWRLLGELVGPEDWKWSSDPIPRCHRRERLDQLLDKSFHFSVDVLCRCLVPASYRNTMHATGKFMDINDHLVSSEKAINPPTGQRVKGACLKQAAVEKWDQTQEDERKQLLDEARARLESPLQEGIPDRREELLGRVSAAEAEAATERSEDDQPLLPPAQPGPVPDDLVEIVSMGLEADKMGYLVRALVEWIAREPYQAFYRRKPVGEPVMGWPERLLRYFWPKPEVGYAETCRRLAPWLETARLLAEKLEHRAQWSKADGDGAVGLARAILDWGDVQQEDFDASTVGKVFWNALRDRAIYEDAPMNSGWTKVAAFATAHLEDQEGRHPQAIWDSRVSTAITWRLDQLLTAAGATQVPHALRYIGSVAGQGGTRHPKRRLALNWRNARSPGTEWSCQFAGSRAVVAMRDTLNDHQRPGTQQPYPPMPLSDGEADRWTVRGVEMVLFGDGY